MKWILSLLICWSASAQLPVIPFNPLLSATAQFTPTNITPKVAYWWVNTDKATNTAWSNWVDRIQGVVFTNGDTGSTRGTNSALGMHFTRTSSQAMTNKVHNSISSTFGNECIWYIINLDTAPADEGWFCLDTTVNSPSILVLSAKPSYFANATTTSGVTLPLNTSVDVFMVAMAASKLAFYTNGIPAITNTVGGGGAFTVNQFNSLGRDLGDGFFDGFTMQIAIITNVVTSEQSLLASNLHYYRTNVPAGLGMPGP